MGKIKKPTYHAIDVFGNSTNITNTPILTCYTLSSDKIRLEIDVSNAKGLITDKEYELSNQHIIWDFGDGGSATGSSVEYNYSWPGKYRISVSVVNADGTVVLYDGVDAPTVTVYNWLEDKLGWYYPDESSPVNMAGNSPRITAGRCSNSFKILRTNSWQTYDYVKGDYNIQLYAGSSSLDEDGNITDHGRSKSIPLITANYYDNKYLQYQRTWRFTRDITALLPISSISTEDIHVYVKQDTDTASPLSGTFYQCASSDEGSTFAGTSGVATVYYTDDTPCDSAVSLIATFDTRDWPEYIRTRYSRNGWFDNIDQSAYSQSELNTTEAPAARASIRVSKPTAEKLLITSNGITAPIFDISRNKFATTEIPFVVSFADNSGNIIKYNNDYIESNKLNYVISENLDLTSEPYDQDSTFNTVEIGLSGTSTPLSGEIIDSVSFSINNNLSSINTPGSFPGILKIDQPVDDICIIARINTSQGILSGASSTFSILPSTGKYNVLKINEDHDFAGTLRSYTMQENINSKTKLTDGLLSESVGDRTSTPETLGKIIYEKISNFNINNIDIDTCNVRNLYSFASQVDYKMKNYNISFPGGVKRIVDLFSIKKSRLFGCRNNNDTDFEKHNIPDPEDKSTIRVGKNRAWTGEQSRIDTETYIVSSGHPLIAKQKFGSVYTKIFPTIVKIDNITDNYISPNGFSGLSSYPLSSYNDDWGWGLSWSPDTTIYGESLSSSFSDYYDFYEYIPNETYPLSTFEQLEGVIDWNSSYENQPGLDILDESISYEEWVKQDGVIDTVLEHKLRTGLQIL